MQRCEVCEPAQLSLDGRVDDHRIGEPGAAVHDSVTHGVNPVDDACDRRVEESLIKSSVVNLNVIG